MAGPLYRKKRQIALKQEVTPGTSVSLSGTDAALIVYNPTASPGGDFTQRQRPGSFSQLKGTVGPKTGTVKFSTDLIGGASLPFWCTVMMAACGMPPVSNVLTLFDSPPGVNGVKTLTIGGYFDGVKKLLRGAVGNVVFNFNTAGQAVRLDWTFMGIWAAPTDVALLSPTLPGTLPLVFSNAGLSWNGYSPKVSTATLDLGNQLGMREDANDPSGYAHGIITGRTPTFKFDPEATLVGTNDPYGAWAAWTEGALALSLGTTGNAVAFAAPKAQISAIDETNRNELDCNDVTLQLNSDAAPNDELTITIT